MEEELLSLFTASQISQILNEINKLFNFSADIEISMEANPGTVSKASLLDYKNCGINRLSLGVQSLNNDSLVQIKRIHDRDTAISAMKNCQEIFDNFNVDIMHSLPNQTTNEAMQDLKDVIAFNPPHISWYQLTLEEGTAFFENNVQNLPNEDTIENTVLNGFELLENNGYEHYEVSAFAKNNQKCKHNTNYWRFGDYLAIGAGGHGKITTSQGIIRHARVEEPFKYISEVAESFKSKQDNLLNETNEFFKEFKSCYSQTHLNNLNDCLKKIKKKYQYLADLHVVSDDELPFEYFLNRLRLFEDFALNEFEKYTGLSLDLITDKLHLFETEGLITIDNGILHITHKGHLFVNTMLESFL